MKPWDEERYRFWEPLSWFGCDESGAIGWFDSAGAGAVPYSAVKREQDWDGQEEQLRVVSYFEEQAPAVTEGILDPEARESWAASLRRRPQKGFENTGSARTAQTWAATGVYVYEAARCDAAPCPYWRFASPREPLVIDRVPAELRPIIERTRLAEVVFARDAILEAAAIERLGGPPSDERVLWIDEPGLVAWMSPSQVFDTILSRWIGRLQGAPSLVARFERGLREHQLYVGDITGAAADRLLDSFEQVFRDLRDEGPGDPTSAGSHRELLRQAETLRERLPRIR